MLTGALPLMSNPATVKQAANQGQVTAALQDGSWLQQIGGSLHHLVDSVSQATAANIVDEVPAGGHSLFSPRLEPPELFQGQVVDQHAGVAIWC